MHRFRMILLMTSIESIHPCDTSLISTTARSEVEDSN